MTTFQGIWQTMVLEEGMRQEQDNNMELNLSERMKHDFYKHLKGKKYKNIFIKNTAYFYYSFK